ncbi:11358_t:CDS:2 [Funneliformis geosporum]|uniref:11358_t:CDS:1 n=1 Tax=Funneliformis geosporum TaxID=1117311 RepID=A0A9W4SJS9_9GLOM|nr:11358_t:CDS:2 [Funneliformis geosporum]
MRKRKATEDIENTCTSEDLNILFQISDTENAYEFITKTLGVPIRNNSPSLSYYANGPEVIFVAICKPSFGNNPKVINIVKSNLNLRKDCILNLRRIINLSILIKSLQDVIGWHETPEFCPIERERQTVEESDTHVEKLKNVYGILTKKKVPNPKNQKELLEAIFCVFETLVWPNIIKLPGEQSKWILIDWDDADGPPTRPAKHLGKENHAPEAFEENHGGEVDIWVQMQSINRPSAHDALEFFRSLTK